ncbi:hypothetical protein [Pseudochryseolinea flava]|uniref:Uncharacterized protein n=1 Tax=Pseudochryseolinea flava TaxID=2059302 RepID=A0A364Y668_9BACT|nr:hypothetical protein [Pseudochryseolinea flava]RAW01598.1 hypothetical protein DQQ10_08035 [Pseudochryseolinea flava]
MNGAIKEIIITAQHQQVALDYENLSTDVIVRFENGDQYAATFYSSKSMERLVNAMDEGGEGVAQYELLQGVLVKNFEEKKLYALVDDMLAEGDFQLIFKKL